jgi:hypothetical protein
MAPRPRVPIVDMEFLYPLPGWMASAACAQPDVLAEHGYDFMIPGRGLRKYEQQMRVCSSCPVRFQCFEYGWDEPYGVWGGMTVPARRAQGGAKGRPFDPSNGQVMIPRSK